MKWKYITLVIFNSLLTFVHPLISRAEPTPYYSTVSIMIMQPFIAFLVAGDYKKKPYRAFWFWSLLLIAGHLFAVGLSSLIQFEELSLFIKDMITCCAFDILWAAIYFLFLWLFTMKLKNSEE